MGHRSRPVGMRAFIIIWIGEVVSLLGMAMTEFGFTIIITSCHAISPFLLYDSVFLYGFSLYRCYHYVFIVGTSLPPGSARLFCRFCGAQNK